MRRDHACVGVGGRMTGEPELPCVGEAQGSYLEGVVRG
jgi:hypothetical protein